MQISINLASVRGQSAGIPRLTFDFESENASDMNLGVVGAYVAIRATPSFADADVSKSYFIGYAVMEDGAGQFSKRTKRRWMFTLPLNPYALQKLEEKRRAGDLFLTAQFFCPVVQMDGGATPLTNLGLASVFSPGYGGPYCPLKVARSDWEGILKDLGYEESARIEEELQRTKERAQAASGEIEQIRDSARKAASIIGVAQHAIHFGAEADNQGKAAWVWLLAAGFFGVLGVVYSWLSFHLAPVLPQQGPDPLWPHVTYLTARLLILSVVFFGMGWSAKNYRANKHNETVNRHRQNALRTFEAFASAAADKDTKDAVLVQATKSIFEPQSSGYLSGESEKVPSGTVVEVLRRVMSGRESS